MSPPSHTPAWAMLAVLTACLATGCTTNPDPSPSTEPERLEEQDADSPRALCERAAALGEGETVARAQTEPREGLLADCVDQLDLMVAGPGRESYEALSRCLAEASDTEEALACDAPPAIIDLLTIGIPPESEFPPGFEPEQVCQRLSQLMLEHIIEDLGVPADETWIPQLIESCVIKLHWDLQRLGPQEATKRWTCALGAQTGAEMAACINGSVS